MFKQEPDILYKQQLTDLGFWYPILKKVGIPTPETYIIHNNLNLIPLVDGKDVIGIKKLIDDIDYYAQKVGYPCFIRTGQSSNKHGWKDSCYLEKKEDILSHLLELQEFSLMADMFNSRSMETIVVRKLIKCKSFFTCFNEMPITREVRIFIKDGAVESIHPYWPKEAFEGRQIEDFENKFTQLNIFNDKDKLLFNEMGTFVSNLLPGYWSLDLLQNEEQEWICIDMAVGDNSYKNKESI